MNEDFQKGSGRILLTGEATLHVPRHLSELVSFVYSSYIFNTALKKIVSSSELGATKSTSSNGLSSREKIAHLHQEASALDEEREARLSAPGVAVVEEVVRSVVVR